MIKILLESAWKEILTIVGSSALLFIISSGISISFKPFHISFNNPCFGIGITLMAIGFFFCMASAYSSGLNRSDYYKGYKKGANDCIERVIDLSKKQEVKEDKNND